jgi:hypothetical protein
MALGAVRVIDMANAGLTLTMARMAPYMRVDPNGGSQTLVLPATALCAGLVCEILNAADAAETITLNDAAGTLVMSIAQNRACTIACDGTSWFGHKYTITLT